MSKWKVDYYVVVHDTFNLTYSGGRGYAFSSSPKKAHRAALSAAYAALDAPGTPIFENVRVYNPHGVLVFEGDPFNL